MADIRRTLLTKFNTSIYRNFGAFLSEMSIEGFRGITETIKFEFPITAISGFNGAGKSSIGQIAVCAYRTPSTDRIYKRKYIKDFFPQSVTLDPAPFAANAKVVYKYATNTPQLQNLTVSRQRVEWSGYKRQPERHCFYVGFAAYIPKIESRGNKMYNNKRMELTERREIGSDIHTHVKQILNSDYDQVWFQGMQADGKTNEIGMLSRYGYTYSENNMGFGEGRLLYMIDLLENEPNNSLFVLEEPETSLHGDAQYKFIKYLMDICNRKGHQVILSTHSSTMLEALPPEGRKFLIRDRRGVKIIDRVSAYRAKSLLSDGRIHALEILVEDSFAKSLLIEIIRQKAPDLLPSIGIHPVGDATAVRQLTEHMISIEHRVIAIRDADQGENRENKIYKLPGSFPPEKEVFHDETVQDEVGKIYNFDVRETLSTAGDLDHHKYSELLATKAHCPKEVLEHIAIKQYIVSKGLPYFDEMLSVITSALQ